MPEDVRSKLAEVIDKAQPADRDTEAMLRELSALATLRRKDPLIEDRYEELRDILSARLKKEGPRYYLDEHGVKWISYPVNVEKVFVDENVLRQLHEQGVLTDVQFELVMPRKVNVEYFKKLVAKKVITDETVNRIATIVPGTSHVRFTTEEGYEEE